MGDARSALVPGRDSEELGEILNRHTPDPV
jgi:hypothetical protein